MYSIKLFSPYFTRGTGKWPNYIDWHFASLKANPTIDFYIFTDDHSIAKWEGIDNIHIIYMTFEECIQLIKSKLGNVAIDKPYKLCDYRPAYGVIFEDWIGDADFWGFYDCDTIMGNLRKYYTDDLLNKYDKLMILGQLQLYRNNEEANHFFCLPRPGNSPYKDFNWEKISSSPENYGYDEGTGAPMLIRENGKSIFWEMKVFANIHQPAYYKHMFDKNVVVNRPFQVWKWSAEEGIYHIDMLSKKKREKLFMHFTQRSLKCIEYKGQTEAYINQKSELKETVKFRESCTGFEYIVLVTKKIFIWIGWHLTHLKGKKSWEM